MSWRPVFRVLGLNLAFGVAAVLFIGGLVPHQLPAVLLAGCGSGTLVATALTIAKSRRTHR